MNVFHIIVWYIGKIWEYTLQMLPCMAIALVVFLLFKPVRRECLRRRGLVSGPWREGVLLLFVVFCAGLASLTLFPANLWAYVTDRLFFPARWTMAWGGRPLASFYPSWEEIMAETDYRNLFTPFQEIFRALYGGSWVFFMLLGNIGMFMPLGFFSALLWRGGRWWKSLLVGFSCSFVIEFVQFFIGRSTDIDDVILNTAGALAGYWLFWMLRGLAPNFVSKFQCYEGKDA